MFVFPTGHDNRLTRFIERNIHRLAGATVCRVRGHRHSRYIWGACDRCCQFYRKPPFRPTPALAPEWRPDPNAGPPDPDRPVRL